MQSEIHSAFLCIIFGLSAKIFPKGYVIMKNKILKNDMKRLNKQKYLLSERDETVDSSIITDPEGSYTGVPVNKKEKPVQDADDL
jgi:hypothetical protein